MSVSEELRCPHCEADEPRLVVIHEEIVRKTYPCYAVIVDGHVHDGIDGEASEEEVLDTITSDEPVIRCEECHEEIDPSDLDSLIPEPEEEEGGEDG